jgi:putative oxidoreductase
MYKMPRRRTKVKQQFTSVAIIRYLVAYVFILVGLLKWLTDDFGLNAFVQIGIPFPEMSVLVIGTIEIICGSLILFDLYVKKATIPLLVVMVGAILTTKLPVLLKSGLWAFAFQSKLDVIMIVLLILLWRENQEA